MATNYMSKKKSCTSDSSTAPSSPSPITALSYVNNVPNTNGTTNAMQNGMMLNNGNAPVAPATIVNGQNASESPSPGINNNNAPKYGTPVPNRIFVGGISAQTTEGELAQLFSAYGNVKGTKIIVDRAGVSKGYGFVTFETEMEARRIMREAQCVIFKQRKLNIAPAIKKQPFSRSLEVQSPPIGIPSTVMYANGSPYMFHNGMAFFSPPEPTPNFPAAPANQIPTVPGAATVCPTMMYPCPPGQPLYQYPYQPVPGHMYRSGQTMQYYLAPQPPPHPPPAMINTENSGFCTYEGQYVQYCDTIQSNEVPVPSQIASNPVYISTANPSAVTNPNPGHHPASCWKPTKTEEKPAQKKRNKTTYRSDDSSPVNETRFVDEGGSGDASTARPTPQSDCQKHAENEDGYDSNAIYYVVPNADSQQSNYLMDNNYVLEQSQTQGIYYGNPPNVSVRISNQHQPLHPKSNAFYYPAPQSAAAVMGNPSPSCGTHVRQNAAAAAIYVNNPFGNVPSSCYLSVDGNYGNQTEGKDSNFWNNDERRNRNAKINVKVKNSTPCKHKEVTKDMKNLKL